MPSPLDVKHDIAKQLGKKALAEHLLYSGQVVNRIERGGVVVQEQRRILDENDLVSYLLEQYAAFSQLIAEDADGFCKGKAIHETMYEHALSRHLMYGLIELGKIKAFADGDFRHLYRFIAFFVRYYYGCEIHAELLRKDGYAKGTGIDHGAYNDVVAACFALMRPDWAKCFFPKELGLVKKSHPTINRVAGLIVGLLHDNAAWKEKAYKDAQTFLEGKRAVSDRALVSYLRDLYDGDTGGMSENLEILMANYHKASWLKLPGGESAAISLFGYYLMGKIYLSEQDFAKLRRPAGPGWWDQYIDICLQKPIPAALSEPVVIFPEPLGFLNTAMRWIEQGPPAGAIRLSMDIK